MPSGQGRRTSDYGPIAIGAGPVGENVADARKHSIRVAIVKSELVGSLPRNSTPTATRGARLVIDEDHRIVVGATLVGQDLWEPLHSAAAVGRPP